MKYKDMTDEELYARLEEYEQEAEILNTRQMGFKVALNSAYGSIGNEFFRFFSVPMAESVTLTGQLDNRWVDKRVNAFLNEALGTNEDYAVYGDTDSVYFSIEPLVEKYASGKPVNEKVEIADRICKKLQIKIDEFVGQLNKYTNAKNPTIEYSREAIAATGFWTAKKRYALNVYDMEGTRYIEPHLKIMGLETARSTTPAVCREHLEEAIKLILTADESTVIDYIENYKKQWYDYDPEQIAFPKGVNNLAKYSDRETIYTKATPIHVRGSLLYNHYVKKHGLEDRYEEITDGDKIKYLYLTLPNPIKEDTIAFVKHIPEEFNVKKYADYNKQFEKAFMEPIKHILTAIGWDHKKRSTLEGLFE